MKKSKVYFISGAKAEGKTTCMHELATLLWEAKVPYGGFLSLGFWKNNQRSHYDLKLMESGEEIKLCNKIAHKKWIKGGCYFFNPESIQRGEKALREAARSDKLILVDEVGKLECQNLIWSKILKSLLSQDKNMIWGVRNIYLEEVNSFFGIKDSMVFPIHQFKPSEIFNKIITDLKTEK